MQKELDQALKMAAQALHDRGVQCPGCRGTSFEARGATSLPIHLGDEEVVGQTNALVLVCSSCRAVLLLETDTAYRP